MFKRIALSGMTLIAAVVLLHLTGLTTEDGGVKTAPSAAPAEPVTTTVVRVVDGDTVVVAPVSGVLPTTPGGGHTVRLLGVDAPEMNPEGSSEPACGARDAASRLARLLEPGQEVTLVWDVRSDRTDRYGRSLAYLEVRTRDGVTDVGQELITEGFAAAWYPVGEPRPQRSDQYERQQAQARDRGSWPVCTTLGR